MDSTTPEERYASRQALEMNAPVSMMSQRPLCLRRTWADAWTWGTEIFCEMEVSHVQTFGKGKGYLVHYALLDDRQVRSPMLWVRAVRLRREPEPLCKRDLI